MKLLLNNADLLNFYSDVYLNEKEPKYKIGAVYALYIIYFTQPTSPKKCLINIDLENLQIIQSLLEYSVKKTYFDLFNILKKMFNEKVFSFGK